MEQEQKSRVSVYLADTRIWEGEEDILAYLELVDVSRREKVLRHRRTEDRKRSLLSGLLLQIGIREWIAGGSQRKEETGSFRAGDRKGQPVTSCSRNQEVLEPLSLCLEEGIHGKPYLKEYPDIYFSLSHSGSYAVCALSDQEVGVDIQQSVRVREGMAVRFFSPEDQELIHQWEAAGAGKEELFFRIWTIKEAYMKLTGEGMSQGLHTTSIHPDSGESRGLFSSGEIRKKSGEGEKGYFKIFSPQENYALTICSYGKHVDIDIRETLISEVFRKKDI